MYEIIRNNSKYYPKKLMKNIQSAPDLYVLGNTSLLDLKAVCIIGSRYMSQYGLDVCKSLASSLSLKDICIISGLAAGIDKTIHEHSLQNNLKCIGVLGFGFNYLSDFENYSLVKQIVDAGGCVISPFESNQKPTARTFIERNKILAALSDCLIVVEATDRSGTFYTVSNAVDFDVPIFAVPGNIFNKNSKGANSLIKSGAYLFDDISEVFSVLKF